MAGECARSRAPVPRRAVALMTMAVLPLAGCGSAPEASRQESRLVPAAREAMGTELRLIAWTGDEPGALAAFEAALDEVDRLESLMSVWREESDIVRLNRAAGRHPVTVAPEVMEALALAREVSGWTDGAFDVTFGALAGIWKFDHDQDNRIPAPAEIRPRLALVDYRALALDPSRRSASLARPGMRVHLGGVGKGYAVDRAAAILRAHGLRDFLIQFGGDSYAAGRRGDRDWRFGIADPRAPATGRFAALDLSDVAFSTSGDYERFFLRDGRRYHHIIDPRTGEPARGLRSVSIVAPTSALADALSTGAFVLGPEDGMALIERLPDVDGVMVTDRNAVLVSSGLRGRLRQLRPPTDAP